MHMRQLGKTLAFCASISGLPFGTPPSREQGKEAGRADHQLLILTEDCCQTTGSPYVLRPVLLEQLLEAGRALERGEARGPFQPLLAPATQLAPPPRSRDRRRGADEAAEEEVPRSSTSSLRVHGTIVPCASRRWVTSCSTWWSSCRSRWLPARTCAPRTGREPGARRPTSPPGPRSSALKRRGASRSAATIRRASAAHER